MDLDCKEYLSELKWKEGYKYLKCDCVAAQVRKDFSRICNICGIQNLHSQSIFICFEMVTSTKGLSASYMGVRYRVTEKTARFFMFKVSEAMESSENYPVDGNVHVDEFVLGGVEKRKIGRSCKIRKKGSHYSDSAYRGWERKTNVCHGY